MVSDDIAISSCSSQSHEIRCKRVQIVIVSCIAGINEPGLIESGFCIQARRFSRVFGAAPEAMVSRLIRCVRSGPKLPVRHGSCDGVAVHAGGSFEDTAAFRHGIIIHRRLLLLLNPSAELFRRIDINAQKHLGMLDAAILSALAKINSGLLRIDPGVIRVVRNQVRLPGQARHPKTVVGIGGKQSEKRGRRIAGLLTGTCSSFAVTTPRAG